MMIRDRPGFRFARIESGAICAPSRHPKGVGPLPCPLLRVAERAQRIDGVRIEAVVSHANAVAANFERW